MTGIHLQTIVDSDGTLILRGLPSLAGHRVDVFLREITATEPRTNRYPLHGKPLRYERPFDGVAQNDWNPDWDAGR